MLPLQRLFIHISANDNLMTGRQAPSTQCWIDCQQDRQCYKHGDCYLLIHSDTVNIQDHTRVNVVDHTRVNIQDHTWVNVVDHTRVNAVNHTRVNIQDHTRVNVMNHTRVKSVNHTWVNCVLRDVQTAGCNPPVVTESRHNSRNVVVMSAWHTSDTITTTIFSCFILLWLGAVLVMASDHRLSGRRFNSQPSNDSGQVVHTPVCLCHQAV